MDLVLEFMTEWWEPICSIGVAAVILWFLFTNEDLKEHRRSLAFGVLLIAVGFGTGYWLADSLHVPKLRIWCGICLSVAASRFFLKVLDRALNDVIGGLIFDIVFSEGPFAERSRRTVKLPNLTLLRHWRDHGMTDKAYQAAKRVLIHEPRAFGHWLFAAETAALHLKRLSTAKNLIRRLCRSKAFPDYYKEYASTAYIAWAARDGHVEDVRQFEIAKVEKKSAVSQACQLRNSGRPHAAVDCLRKALRENPDDQAAAFQLILVLTEELEDFRAAEAVIETIAQQPNPPVAFLDFARATLQENRAAAAGGAKIKLGTARDKFAVEPFSTDTPPAPSPNPSVIVNAAAPALPVANSGMAPSADPNLDSLLEANMFGSAIDYLKQGLDAYPDDYAGWMRLANIYIVSCHQKTAAERVIAQILKNPNFTPEQKAEAEATLRKWKQDAMRLA